MELLTWFTRPRPHRIRVLRVALALGGAASVRAAPPAAPPSISNEHQIEAVFLFNFAQFVEWPAGAFPAKDSPVIIAVLGADPFGSYLDDLVRGEKIGPRPLVVHRATRPEDAANSHILFISRSESDELARLLPAFAGRPILTIGDADNFTRAGGMVRFVTENGKIRLRINLAAARAAGLVVSSKIIRPSTIVTAGKD